MTTAAMRDLCLTLAILAAVGMLLVVTTRRPGCTAWATVDTPAKTEEREYFVKDTDGTQHLVTVREFRPAHTDRICTTRK